LWSRRAISQRGVRCVSIRSLHCGTNSAFKEGS
jgi:hypothetical protein